MKPALKDEDFGAVRRLYIPASNSFYNGAYWGYQKGGERVVESNEKRLGGLNLRWDMDQGKDLIVKGTSHFEHLSRGGGFKVVFLKISNPGFLQTSTFVTYFLILFWYFSYDPPKGVNKGVPPLKMSFFVFEDIAFNFFAKLLIWLVHYHINSWLTIPRGGVNLPHPLKMSFFCFWR